MRIGPLTIRLLALLAVGLAGGKLVAQPGGGSNYQPPQFQSLDGGATAARPMQAMFYTPMGMDAQSPYVDAYGNPTVVPASYCADSCEGYSCDGCGECGCAGAYDCPPDCYCESCSQGGMGGCRCCRCCRYGCGGTWQDPRAGTYPPFPDDVEDYSLLPPCRTEQCGPHYFDVRMEAVYMTRDEAFGTPVDFTSNNVTGPIVLSSTQLDFEYETGFRILGRYDCGPLSVVEFGYWGLENLDASATVFDDQADLFSIFTNFANPLLPDGVTPALPAGVAVTGGPLPWTERSLRHTISLESELHTGEFNYRRYWVGFNPTVSGTLLAGFRYTRLREDFQFATLGSDELTFGVSSAEYLESIKNDLAGFQAGADIWLHIRQGVRIGAEGKVGLMNNHYTLDNTFTSIGENDNSGPPPNFTEHFEKDQPALVVDASADLVWDICPSWSVRAGYEILFLNSVLLAGENFNEGTVYNTPEYQVPGVNLPERVPFVNNQGDAFYHGAHLGAEYVW